MNNNLPPRFVLTLLIMAAAASLISSILYADEYEDRYKLFVPYVKEMPASRLDPALPDVPFEKWLTSHIKPGSEIYWEVNDCGEDTGFEGPGNGRDHVTCVGVEAELKNGSKLVINIAVGTVKKGRVGEPRIFSGGDALRALANPDNTPY